MKHNTFDGFSEEEIEKSWKAETQDTGEDIRLNVKHVWETAKNVATSSTHMRTRSTSPRLENIRGMRKAMCVIKEAHDTKKR